ncbi:hypothetical protein [Spirosoma litoris]
MNKKHLFLSVIALAAGLSTQSVKAQVNLKSISIGASYWKPSLDYWNERSSLIAYNGGAGAKFSGSVMPTLGLEVGLVKGLSVGGRVGYWSQSVSSDLTFGGNRNEKITLSVIPLSLDLKYTFLEPAAVSKDEAAPKEPFALPYIGVSVARYFINDKFVRTVAAGGTGSVNETQAGNNYGVQVFVGAEKKLVKKLYLALDVRYHLGSYNQIVRTETASTTEKVSLNGLEAGLSLRVKFK